MDRMMSFRSNCPIMLVGTNIENKDERTVNEKHLSTLIDTDQEVKHAEVSLVTGENVETALQTITRDMIAHATKPDPEPATVLPVKTEPKKCIVS